MTVGVIVCGDGDGKCTVGSVDGGGGEGEEEVEGSVAVINCP